MNKNINFITIWAIPTNNLNNTIIGKDKCKSLLKRDNVIMPNRVKSIGRWERDIFIPHKEMI